MFFLVFRPYPTTITQLPRPFTKEVAEATAGRAVEALAAKPVAARAELEGEEIKNLAQGAGWQWGGLVDKACRHVGTGWYRQITITEKEGGGCKRRPTLPSPPTSRSGEPPNPPCQGPRGTTHRIKTSSRPQQELTANYTDIPPPPEMVSDHQSQHQPLAKNERNRPNRHCRRTACHPNKNVPLGETIAVFLCLFRMSDPFSHHNRYFLLGLCFVDEATGEYTGPEVWHKLGRGPDIHQVGGYYPP